MRRSSICLPLLAVLLLGAVPASADTIRYRVVDLGLGAADGIDNSGQAVGTSFIAGGSYAVSGRGTVSRAGGGGV